uniref:HSA domain-containing protein n=1 Tax=Panagrolaimus davidi TaxID=227884 RepID=A0A914QH07_9BILA
MFRIEKNQSKAISTPKSIDPNFIAEEREQRISTRILARIKQLSALPSSELPEYLQIRTTILLRGLRLINLQAAVRYEVINSLKMGSIIEFAINPHAYRRIKRHTLREARIIEKLEKQRRMEQESRRKLRHTSFLQNVIQGSKDFVGFHKNNHNIISKNRKSIATFHANNEKERQKKKERNEKLRLSKLMAEDEEGYRKLLDEKKDKRLVYILKQTDEYVKNLTGLVQQHQQIEKKRKKEERDAERKFVESKTF